MALKIRRDLSKLQRPKVRNHLSASLPTSIHTSSYNLVVNMAPATTASTVDLVSRTVTVAPLVLLSVADHYGRSAQGTKKRVVGVLLGQNDAKGIRVSNSFGGKLHIFCTSLKLSTCLKSCCA